MMTWFESTSTGGLSAWRWAVLGSGNSQFSKLPITKSESVAVGLAEERVSARKLAKQLPRPRELRFTPSSRNSPAAGPLAPLLFVNDHGTVIGPPLTIA